MTTNGPGNKYLTEEQIQRAAAERGLILSKVGERPEVRVVYLREKTEVGA